MPKRNYIVAAHPPLRYAEDVDVLDLVQHVNQALLPVEGQTHWMHFHPLEVVEMAD